jgi:hypothetical protein
VTNLASNAALVLTLVGGASAVPVSTLAKSDRLTPFLESLAMHAHQQFIRSSLSLLFISFLSQGCESNSTNANQLSITDAGTTSSLSSDARTESNTTLGAATNSDSGMPQSASNAATSETTFGRDASAGSSGSIDGGIAARGTNETERNSHGHSSTPTSTTGVSSTEREHDAGVTDVDGWTAASSAGDSGDTTEVDATSVPAATTEHTAESTEPPPLKNYLPCDIERIIASRCRVCHSQAGNAQAPLLDTWGDVSAEADLILEVVLEDYMPMLPPPLTEEQKASLETWVISGAQPVKQSSAPTCP